MLQNNLITQFESQSYKVWKQEAIKSLKERPFDDLVKLSYDGIEIQPYYSNSENLFDKIYTNYKEKNDWVILNRTDFFYDANNHVIESTILHNEGASSKIEIANAINKFMSLLESTKNNKLNINFLFSINTDFFNQIAKIRAFKLLLNSIIINNSKLNRKLIVEYKIYATPSNTSFTNIDIENNILRQTTEAMSAIIAGVDGLYLPPFDNENDNSIHKSYTKRISENINEILKYESGFDKVVDAVKGSYYIETLTKQLAEKSYTYLQDILLLNNTNIEKKFSVDAHANQKKQKENFSVCKDIIVGINKYPNKNKYRNPEFFSMVISKSIILEQIRFFVQQNNFSVCLVNFGEIVDFKEMNNFANEYFSIAGYEIESLETFDIVEDAISTLTLIKNDIIIICSSNKIYKNIIPELVSELKKKTDKTLVLAGKPKEDIQRYSNLGLDFYIYSGQNIVETHKDLVTRLIKKNRKNLEVK